MARIKRGWQRLKIQAFIKPETLYLLEQLCYQYTHDDNLSKMTEIIIDNAVQLSRYSPEQQLAMREYIQQREANKTKRGKR